MDIEITTDIIARDDNGDEIIALDYILSDAGHAPGSFFGTYPSDWSVPALLLYMVYCDSAGECDLHSLDGAISQVVNAGDGAVLSTLLDSRHVFEGCTLHGEPIDLYDMFSDDEIDAARASFEIGYCGEPCPF